MSLIGDRLLAAGGEKATLGARPSFRRTFAPRQRRLRRREMQALANIVAGCTTGSAANTRAVPVRRP